LPDRDGVLRRRFAVATVAGVPRSSPHRHHFPATGIDRLLTENRYENRLRGRRVGLLTHDACRTADGIATRRAVARALDRSTTGGLVRLFTPEHGLRSRSPAGAAVGDGRDGKTGAELVSLYGPRFVPDAAQLAGLDVIVIDLRDVGVRCFTYAATAARLIAAATAGDGPAIIVCDRPNPLGPRMAGPALDPDLRSLVAWLDVPFVHGRSIGDLLALAAAADDTDRFEIIAARGHLAGTPPGGWIAPSPALDHPQAVHLYPGLVLLEGTNLSEGRGTPASFRSVAAAWLDTADLAAEIARWRIPVEVERRQLTAATGRYARETLPALVFDLPDPAAFDGFAFGIRLLCAIAARHPEFAWTRRGPNPAPVAEAGTAWTIDALLGSRSLREAMARGEPADALLESWRRD
jgi:uncharacterized protein YbbC (DUF1343 family)